MHRLEKELTKLHTSQQALQKQLNEKQTHLLELKKLHQNTQENLEHYRQTSQEQRQIESERHTQQELQSQQKITQLQSTQEALTREAQNLCQQNALLMYKEKESQDALLSCKQRAQILKNEIATVNTNITKANQSTSHWQSQHQKMQQETKTLNTTVVDLEKKLAITSHQLRSATEMLTEQKTLIQSLQDNMKDLRRKKAIRKQSGRCQKCSKIRVFSDATTPY